MISTLTTLEQLLRKHGHDGQADVARELIALHESDHALFVKECQDVAVWGGSGAVWEVGDLGTDTRIFRDAVIELADQMEAGGFATERSRFIASIFRKWQAARQ